MFINAVCGRNFGGGNLDKLILLQNDLNYTKSEMLNTYTYKLGIVNAKYSYATAIGLEPLSSVVFW